MRENEKVVLIEIADGHPFHVSTVDEQGSFDHYDFDWSEFAGMCFYCCCGCGGSLYLDRPGRSRYWLAPGYEIEDADPAQRIHDLAELPADAQPDKVFTFSAEGWMIYCGECDTLVRTPEVDCPHVRYCENCERDTTAADPCDCEYARIDPYDTRGAEWLTV